MDIHRISTEYPFPVRDLFKELFKRSLKNIFLEGSFPANLIGCIHAVLLIIQFTPCSSYHAVHTMQFTPSNSLCIIYSVYRDHKQSTAVNLPFYCSLSLYPVTPAYLIRSVLSNSFSRLSWSVLPSILRSALWSVLDQSWIALRSLPDRS